MQRLDATSADFAARFDALVNARREADSDVSSAVRDIIAKVRKDGDAALAELTKAFDRHDLDATGWRVGEDDMQAALDGLPADLRAALELAAQRIATYHAQQR
ncbi:MAG: histidinol dehydrogenase, partial [Sphingobium sp. 32-64-5]